VLIETSLDPEGLLDACKEIERDLGRSPAGIRHGPRPIDVDVLMLGDLEQDSERLSLPHPEVTCRRFVLEPLLELDPELRLPDGRELSGFLAAVADQRVTPHAGVSWL
jgi:2-amino-4-hydroxy-6-hydroxymethyldihydropteridine diphosphokinase